MLGIVPCWRSHPLETRTRSGGRPDASPRMTRFAGKEAETAGFAVKRLD
jgi:hypothetical protein